MTEALDPGARLRLCPGHTEEASPAIPESERHTAAATRPNDHSFMSLRISLLNPDSSNS